MNSSRVHICRSTASDAPTALSVNTDHSSSSISTRHLSIRITAGIRREKDARSRREEKKSRPLGDRGVFRQILNYRGPTFRWLFSRRRRSNADRRGKVMRVEDGMSKFARASFLFRARISNCEFLRACTRSGRDYDRPPISEKTTMTTCDDIAFVFAVFDRDTARHR